MATTWPQATAWPNDLQEHATYLSNYLREALKCIESATDQPVPTPLVKTIITATYSLLKKVESTPDNNAVMQALAAIHGDVKTTATTVQATATTVQKSAIASQQAVTISQDIRVITKEAVEARRAATTLLQETNDIAKAIQSSPIPKSSYASVLSSNIAPLSKPITISTQTSSFIQAQREIIVKITETSTIENLRAKNPRTLQSHVDRAIEQSRNKHIEHIRVASANQLKSGDLSIKTTTGEDAETLRQFANLWVSKVGNGTAIRVPTYGIIAHGIRTKSMDMAKFNETRVELLQDNKPFIPNAEIKYIGWLSKSALTKSASSIIVEFTKPEDANKIIDEGLIWQGEAFQCERYDRQCRLKQCYNCQKYGHIGTQCKASIACGYCSEQHSSRDCPTKADKSATRKCAACQGPHEAWNNRCPVRKTELCKIKAAYDIRQPYHFVPPSKDSRAKDTFTFSGTPAETTTVRTGRPLARPRIAGTPSSAPSAQSARSRSPTKERAPKRVNIRTDWEAADDENNDVVMIESSQRPQRTSIPTRKVLEAITPNIHLRPHATEEEL